MTQVSRPCTGIGGIVTLLSRGYSHLTQDINFRIYWIHLIRSTIDLLSPLCHLRPEAPTGRRIQSLSGQNIRCFPVQSSTWKPVILTDIFHGFLQSLKTHLIHRILTGPSVFHSAFCVICHSQIASYLALKDYGLRIGSASDLCTDRYPVYCGLFLCVSWPQIPRLEWSRMPCWGDSDYSHWLYNLIDENSVSPKH